MAKLFTYTLSSYEVATSCISCKLGGGGINGSTITVVANSSSGKSVGDSSSSSSSSSGSTMDGEQAKEYIVVGTAVSRPGDVEPRSGRLLVFEILRQAGLAYSSSSSGPVVEGDRIVRLVAEKAIKSAAFSLAGINGKLAVGVGSKVQLLVLAYDSVIVITFNC